MLNTCRLATDWWDRVSEHFEFVGGASAASEATLSSCPLRFAVYVGIIVRAINP